MPATKPTPYSTGNERNCCPASHERARCRAGSSRAPARPDEVTVGGRAARGLLIGRRGDLSRDPVGGRPAPDARSARRRLPLPGRGPGPGLGPLPRRPEHRGHRRRRRLRPAVRRAPARAATRPDRFPGGMSTSSKRHPVRVHGMEGSPGFNDPCDPEARAADRSRMPPISSSTCGRCPASRRQRDRHGDRRPAGNPLKHHANPYASCPAGWLVEWQPKAIDGGGPTGSSVPATPTACSSSIWRTPP